MKIVTTFHPSSSVVASIKCRLAAADVEHLVTAKLSRVDIYSLKPQGLHHECGVEIWGKVLSIKAVPISGSPRSNLILLTAHPDPELIFFSYAEFVDGSAELTVNKQLQLYERTPRQAEFFNEILVHPSGKLAVVGCYTGKLKVITFKASGRFEQEFDVSLPELNVFSLSFLPSPEGEYSLAILHLDHQARIQLLARDINVEELELSSGPSIVLHPTPISNKIIPYPTEDIPILISVPPAQNNDAVDSSFLGGVLVVGGKRILLFELASSDGQEKQKGKRRRLETKKNSIDSVEAAKAREKEKEREGRRRKPKCSVEWPWSEISTWCTVEPDSGKYFVADAYGRLAMLSVDNLNDHGLIIIPLGETSPATTLTYLTNQTLYIGSHMGDSQLIQISPTPLSSTDSPTLVIPSDVKTVSTQALVLSHSKGKGKAADDDIDMEMDPSSGCIVETMGSYINVRDTYKNIAPIMDAVLVDTDGSGQKQIVTCSGGRNTGSINIIRNGADFQELAFIQGLTDIARVWSVRDMFEDKCDSHLFVSTVYSSHLFRIQGAGSDISLLKVEASTGGLITDQPTLAFANVAKRILNPPNPATYANSALVVQVTPAGAYLFEYDLVFGYVRKSSWTLPLLEVIAASINASQLVLALNGGKFVVLSITDKLDFAKLAERTSGLEISAVSCTPINPSKPFTNIIPVAYWGTNIIEVFSIHDKGFISLCKSSPLPALVRSLLFYNFGSEQNPKAEGYHPYLLAGLSDGSLITFMWKDKQLKDQKLISLGHAPVSLTPSQVDGKRIIFAAGSRATILSWDKKRLNYSPIMLKEISAVSSLNTQTFASSLVLGTSTGVFIGRVKDLDKLHIRSIPYGLDNPRRIAYQPLLKAFGVACIHTDPNRLGQQPSTRSSFKLLDDTTFEQLSQFMCNPDEEITAIASFSITDANGRPRPLFCLGTYVFQADDKEPVAGRLVIFTASSFEDQRKSGLHLSQITSTDVKGCVYALAVVDEIIVAAVNSSIISFYLKEEEDIISPSWKILRLSEWNHNYLVTSLGSFDSYIVAGDQISSVSLLKVTHSNISSIAKDFGPLWPVCVEASNAEHVIGANDTLNLFSFSLSRNIGRSVLERDGSYHVADLVTKFIRGSISASDVSSTATFVPEHIFFTSSGRICIVVDIEDDDLALNLTALQRNLASTVQGIGGISHTRFRAPKNGRGFSDADSSAFGFLDGDFMEQFLSLMGSPQQLDKVLKGQSAPEQLLMNVETIQKTLENLQNLH